MLDGLVMCWTDLSRVGRTRLVLDGLVLCWTDSALVGQTRLMLNGPILCWSELSRHQGLGPASVAGLPSYLQLRSAALSF